MNKILVIDDEKGPRESLRILLKNDYEVKLADSVDKGVDTLKEWKPDLIILDIRMPGKNGIVGLQEIRTIDPNVSVIMLTGFGALETAQEAIRHGANDYLKKPFDIEEIQETIRHNIERSQVEKKRSRALEDLHELNRQLSEEVQQKEHLAALGQASAEFAHDIRNPLMVIMGYCQLLYNEIKETRERDADTDLQETMTYLEVIENNVERCHEMAQTWQSFGKVDISNGKPASLARLLKEVADGARSMHREGKPDVSIKTDLTDATVMTSPSHLLRVLNNIVGNAMDAIEGEGGIIEIKCGPVDGMAEISIADNGMGMSPENVEKSFQPYFTTKEVGKGTGLGLYIARKIIEEHKGSISMTSSPGKGTTVTIKLPVHSADE